MATIRTIVIMGTSIKLILFKLFAPFLTILSDIRKSEIIKANDKMFPQPLAISILPANIEEEKIKQTRKFKMKDSLDFSSLLTA